MPYVLRGSLGDEHRIETQASIGRDASNQIVLPDLLVSRLHATAKVEQGVLRVVDHGSANGTRVNGVRVSTAALRPGDTVQFGNTPMTVAYLPDPSAGGTAQTVMGVPEPFGASAGPGLRAAAGGFCAAGVFRPRLWPGAAGESISACRAGIRANGAAVSRGRRARIWHARIPRAGQAHEERAGSNPSLRVLFADRAVRVAGCKRLSWASIRNRQPGDVWVGAGRRRR